MASRTPNADAVEYLLGKPINGRPHDEPERTRGAHGDIGAAVAALRGKSSRTIFVRIVSAARRAISWRKALANEMDRVTPGERSFGKNLRQKRSPQSDLNKRMPGDYDLPSHPRAVTKKEKINQASQYVVHHVRRL